MIMQLVYVLRMIDPNRNYSIVDVYATHDALVRELCNHVMHQYPHPGVITTEENAIAFLHTVGVRVIIQQKPVYE